MNYVSDFIINYEIKLNIITNLIIIIDNIKIMYVDIFCKLNSNRCIQCFYFFMNSIYIYCK